MAASPPPAAFGGLPQAQSLERRRLRQMVLRVFLDLALLIASFAATGFFYLGDLADPAGLGQAWLLAPIFVLTAIQARVYSLGSLTSIQRDCFRFLVTVGLSSALFVFVTFYTKSTAEYSRVTFTIAMAGFVFFAIAYRWALYRALIRSGRLPVENVLLIKAGGPDVNLPKAMVVDADAHDLVPDPDNPEYFDRIGFLLHNIDRVIVSCTIENRSLWAPVLRATGVKGELVSPVIAELGAFGIEREDSFATLVVSSRPLNLAARITKRAMDLAIASGAVLVLSPIMIGVAIAIKLEDRGPILFRQQRVGRSNRFFHVLKFRSMYVDRLDMDASKQTTRDDDRVTRVGRFIRRTSIDELPQLINVLKGDMSLVGPRPHALGALAGEKHYWRVDERYWQRHSLRPGLTGLAQVRGYRGATDREQDLTDRVGSDLEYIANWSPWLDLVILAMTARVLVHDNAY